MFDRMNNYAPPTAEDLARFKAAFEAHMATRPPLVEALRLDARSFRLHRLQSWPETGGLRQFIVGLRLCWSSDDFLGVVIYRVRTSLRRMGIPIIPMLLHRVCMLVFGIRIGDPVVIQPGMYVPHGNIVIDGFVSIGRGAVLCPWITVGLRAGALTGPNIGNAVFIGTGAKIIGPVTIGDNARVGAGSVVVRDVPAWTSVTGVPARPSATPPAEGEPV